MTENEAWDMYHSGELGSYYETWLMVRFGVTMDEAIEMARRDVDCEIFVKEWM